METVKALAIIKALSEGIDPRTGEVFLPDSPYQHPDVIRALFKAIDALEYMQKRNRFPKSLPANAGKPGHKEEDDLLLKEFDEGKSFKDLAQSHKRTEGAIRSRLVRLGKITFLDMK